jgi:hypothetical protein
MTPSYYFKKTSVLLHSATYKLLYGERAKKMHKSFLSWKILKIEMPHAAKNEK